MGVENLWLLLEPTGSKIKIDRLATRKLAVDASLWLVQFIKAMREPNGEMTANCHLLGLFRRICKLMFYNIKPVFVFDGPAPALKRKTLAQRRERRKRNEDDIRKMAERLFLNQCQMAAISVSKKQLKALRKQKQETAVEEVVEAATSHDENCDDAHHHNHNHNQSAVSVTAINDANINGVELDRAFVFDDDESPPKQNHSPNGDSDEEDMAGGFFVDDADELNGSTNHDHDANQNKDSVAVVARNRDKEEMSDTDDDNQDSELAARPLTSRTCTEANDNDVHVDEEEPGEDGDMEHAMEEANAFYQFPTDHDVSQMTAEDIAQLPASMQFEIMSKRRELLRHKTRPEFVNAAGNPNEYAQVQLKNFLKTSSLNQKIEALRKRTADEYNRQLANENGGDDDACDNNHSRVRVRRIASEGDKLFWIKQTTTTTDAQGAGTCGANHNGGFRFEWMDKQTQQKRQQWMQGKGGGRHRRKSKWSTSNDYVAKTLNIEWANRQAALTASGASEIVFEHWSCPICKYLNLKQRRKCDVCGIVRTQALQQWRCTQCTHVNEGKHKRCVLCDTLNIECMEESEKRMHLLLGHENDAYCEPTLIRVEEEEDDDAVITGQHWICSVCDWKNSKLNLKCAQCSKQKPVSSSSYEDETKEEVAPLLLPQENDDVSELEDMQFVAHAHAHAHNDDDDGDGEDEDEDEDGEDDDLVLLVPQSTLDLDFQLEQFDELDCPSKTRHDEYTPTLTIMSTPQTSPHKTAEASPSKSASSLSEMASSLINVRDSLNNFYNIARMTQQNGPLEGIDDDAEEETHEQPTDILHVSMDHSEHESDDDIIHDMHVTAGCDDAATPDAPINQAPPIDACARDVADAMPEAVPETFRFCIPGLNGHDDESDIIAVDHAAAASVSENENEIDEEDEKQMEITDLNETYEALADVQAILGHTSNPNDDVYGHASDFDALEENKPLRRRPRKRKLLSNNDNSSPVVALASPNKKRKIDVDAAQLPTTTTTTTSSTVVDRNIGLNDGQIQNSLQNLYSMEDKLVEENIGLYDFQSNAIRNSEHITPSMIDECRHLLDLFGIPYVTAPSEAEAQCAALDVLGLVDGIITDDSDVFLFGGKTIYKHMFHLNKFVEKYTTTLIATKLGLTQKKLIALAMLLGSDYTDGIKGIGPVNGMEIIQTFCSHSRSEEMEEFEGLVEFKKWIYSTTKDKKPKRKPDPKIQTLQEYMSLKKIWFKYKHVGMKKRWFVEQAFPDQTVMDTYLQPQVDESDAKFEWGVPDIAKLRVFCKQKFDWDDVRIDSTLDPIQKAVQNRGVPVQSSILSFADWVQPNKNIKSQRMQKAVQALIEEIELRKQMATSEESERASYL